MEFVIFVMIHLVQKPELIKLCILKPDGPKSQQSAGSKFVISQEDKTKQNETKQKKIIYCPNILPVQSNKKQILWFNKVRVQKS